MTVGLLVVLWCVNLLPFRAKIWCGLTAGGWLYRLSSSRVSIARVNIAICFPDLSDSQRERMVKDTFRHLGAGLVETAISWWDDSRKIHAMTEIRGMEYLEKAESVGRGVILLGAHYSTLDLGAMLVAKCRPVYAVYREQNNRVINYFMMRGRKKHLLGCISHESMRGAAKRLRDGKIVWFSADQDMGEERSVYAPFFGHPAATIKSVSRLAKLARTPLVMLVTRRREDNTGYIMEFLPAPDGYPFDEEVKNAATINQLTERGILFAPSQYYWFHRRFKTQPDRNRGELYGQRV